MALEDVNRLLDGTDPEDLRQRPHRNETHTYSRIGRRGVYLFLCGLVFCQRNELCNMILFWVPEMVPSLFIVKYVKSYGFWGPCIELRIFFEKSI